MPTPFALPDLMIGQKLVGTVLTTTDTNTPPNVVPLPNSPPIPTVTQSGVLSVMNMQEVAGDDPTLSKWQFDILAGPGVSSGVVTINMQTHQSNGTAGFVKPLTLNILPNPSIPGPAADFTVTPGTIQ